MFSLTTRITAVVVLNMRQSGRRWLYSYTQVRTPVTV